jgi:small subunit ribosomal protein S18
MEKKSIIRRRSRKRKPCVFCVNKVDIIDYKDIPKFKRYITDRGKIYPRRNSGICAKHQRKMAEAIKRARFMCLIPHCVE